MHGENMKVFTRPLPSKGADSPPSLHDDRTPSPDSRRTSRGSTFTQFSGTKRDTHSATISYPDYFAPEYHLSYKRISPSSMHRYGKFGYQLYILRRQTKLWLSKISPVMRFSLLWLSLCVGLTLVALVCLCYLLFAESGSGGLVNLVGGAISLSGMANSIQTMKDLHLEAAVGGKDLAGIDDRTRKFTVGDSVLSSSADSREFHRSNYFHPQGYADQRTQSLLTSSISPTTNAVDTWKSYHASLTEQLNSNIVTERFTSPIYAGLFDTHLSKLNEYQLRQIRLLQFLNAISLSSLIGTQVLYNRGSFYNASASSTGSISEEQQQGNALRLYQQFYSGIHRCEQFAKILRGTFPNSLYEEFEKDVLSSSEFTSWTNINNQVLISVAAADYQFSPSSSITDQSYLYYRENASIILSKSHVYLDHTTQNMRTGNLILLAVNCVQIFCLLLVLCITIPVSFAPVVCCSHCIVYPIKKRTEISKDIISKFVPKGFLKLIGAQSIVELRLGNAKRENLSVMFVDIRDFQSIASRMEPRQLFEFLNKYLRYIGPCIRKHNGYTDKYLGSGLLALFPQNAADAVRASVQMHHKVMLLNKEHSNKKASKGFPKKISICIGIHTGTCIVGVIGEKARIDASIIGDSVNLASRIHGLTKRYAAHTLITKDTLDQCSTKEFMVRYLGTVAPKGKSVPIPVHEVLDPKLNRKKILTRAYFERGMNLMLECNFNLAKKHFEQILQMDPSDRCSAIRKEQCDEFKERDAVWDGTLVVNEK